MKYDPQVGETISIAGDEYRFVRLEAAPGFSLVHAASGRKGTVFRLAAVENPAHEYALKVFEPQFQTAYIAVSSAQLARYRGTRGHHTYA